MEEPLLPEVDDHGMHNVPSENTDTKANNSRYISTHIILIFNIICTLCLVLTITLNKKLRGNQNNWPIVYFGMTAFLHAVIVIIIANYKVFQTGPSLSASACVVIQVLVYAVVLARFPSLLFLLIDRVDWLSDSNRHDKRMSPKAYGITIGVLWLTVLVVSMAFFARPVASSDYRVFGRCVSITSSEFLVFMRVLDLIEMLLLVAIFIAALIVYKKRPATEDEDEVAAEAKETVIVTCVLSALMLAFLISGILHMEIRGSNILHYLNAVFNGIASLMMLFTFSKIRRGFFCRSSDEARENVPLPIRS